MWSGGDLRDFARDGDMGNRWVYGHDATWRDYVREELYEFDPVREAVACG